MSRDITEEIKNILGHDEFIISQMTNDLFVSHGYGVKIDLYFENSRG